MAPLSGGMKDDFKHRLKNGYAVKSEDHDDVYFVSAEIYGSDVDEGTIGTWRRRASAAPRRSGRSTTLRRNTQTCATGRRSATWRPTTTASPSTKECIEAAG
jgi:hypothetical protein